MSDSAAPIVLTGATGFVGNVLVLELLDRTESDLLCVSRPGLGEDAGSRLREALLGACEAYGREDLEDAVETRTSAVPGDLLAERCGADPELLSSARAFVHCAASLSFQDRHREDILAANVTGTVNALALAEAAGIPAFHYLSTAYVAGDREGTIAEGPVPPETHSNNVYEQSKIKAEALVAAAPIPTRQIIRPSVVIGHSKTFHATSFTGMYGFIRALWKANQIIEVRLGGLLRYRPLRFDFAEDFALNLIPVDAVARSIRALVADPPEGVSYHHVANITPPPIGASIALLCETLGLARPVFSVPASELSSIDSEISRATRFWRSYLRFPKTFETAATEAVVGAADLTWDLPPERLYPYGIWYLDQLNSEYSKRTAETGAASG